MLTVKNVILKGKTMTGNQFRAKSILLGLDTQEKTARALGLSVRTVSAIWNTDRVKIIYQLALLGYEFKKSKGEL